MSDALQSTLTATGLAIARLGAVKTPQQGVEFFRQLGYKLPPAAFGPALPALATQASGLNAAVAALASAIDGAAIAVAALNLMNHLRGVVQAVRALQVQLQVGGGAVPNLADLPRRLTDFLILDYLGTRGAQAHEVLHLLGLIEHEPEPETGQPSRLINWTRFSQFLKQPGRIFNDVYGWDTSFDFSKALSRLEDVMRAAYLPGGAYPHPGSVQAVLGPDPALPELRFPIFQKGLTPATYSQFGITFAPVEANESQKAGFALFPYIIGAAEFQFDVCERGELTFESMADIRGIGIVVRPPFDAQGVKNLTGSFRAAIGVREKAKSAEETILFGTPGGTRLSLQGLGIKWFVAGSREKLDLGVQGEIDAMRLVIAGGDGDGFLQKVLSGIHVEARTTLGFGMSLASGFTFQGGGKLAFEIGTHINLGLVRVDALRLALEPTADAFVLETGAVLNFGLGPLEVVVQNVGVRAALRFQAGNLGPADLDVSFMPPNGIGLELNAGGFTGGGFLFLDSDKGEYAGGLELTFLGAISVRAVGILSTRLPDGSKGFSLLIILASEFPPIQLSYGFTLLGIGGMLGLNRTVLVDALQAGVRDGSLNSILFPEDIVANAARIIGDIKRIFPPRDGRFLVGPMAKLGWGTPTLISLSVGFILEIPRPLFAFVGVLHMALPAEDLPILHLQVSFAGSIDFESGRLQFDASLYDSRVLTFTLSGDMALRVYWKDNANFLLSVGGFHPAYTPPPMNLGELARLGIVLFQGIPHMSAQVYFAVTSNSVQFGARVEVYYGIDLFNVYGFLGLDVLINFNPFHFVAEIEAQVGVRTGSDVLFAITLQLILEGPTPWHARGTASFRIGFIIKVTISANFDVSFGDPQETHLESIDVLAEMVNALGNLGNWRPLLPPGSNQHVTLRALPVASATLVMHPFGALEITQKLVPLHVAIQRFGTRTPSAGSVFTLADVKLGSGPAAVTNTREQFAPAQFFDLSDAEKLSRPSFADYDAGIVIGGDLAAQTDFQRGRDVVYELIYLPEHNPFALFYSMTAILASFVSLGSAAAQSPVSHATNSVSALEQQASLVPERYAVVSTDNLTMHAADLVFDNATAAHQSIQNIVANKPEFFGAIQVVPISSVAARGVV